MPSPVMFLRQQAASALACDFLTVETAFLQRIYVLFFISLATRRVEYIACTASPDGAWVTQQARNLVMQVGDEQSFRLLIHDRDKKFSHAFDGVFCSEGIEVIRTPIQAPNANAYAERWVRTVRADCLDRILILGRRHLEHAAGSTAAITTSNDPTARSTSYRPTAPSLFTSEQRPSACIAATSSADSFANIKPPREFAHPTGSGRAY
jgi:putative transposase